MGTIRQALGANVVASFLYNLCGGMLLITATARAEQIAWKFLRLIGFLCFGMTCLVAFWSLVRGPEQSTPSLVWALKLGIATAGVSFLLVFTAGLSVGKPGWIRMICLLGGCASLAASGLSVVAPMSLADQPASSTLLLVIAGNLLSGLLLGSITVAWLLGHAYLTATKMTIAPLRYFSRVLLWAVGARLVFLLVFVGLPFINISIAGSPSATALSGSWILLLLRVGVGLMAVGVFSYMVADCVRLRATQSATGILYFGSVLAYVGELTSLYLSMQFVWPV